MFPKVPLKGSHIVRMSKSGLVLAPMVTLKVLVNIRLGQNVPFISIINLYFLNFSQKCHPGLPGGQDGQVGAGHGSHLVPEGPDQL